MHEGPDLLASAAARRTADLRRSEQTMSWVRAAGVVFALALVLLYNVMPFPPVYRQAALGLVAAMAVLDVVVVGALLAGRPRTPQGVHRLAVLTTVADIAIACAFVWCFSFDPVSAHWAILFLTPLLGAARFHLPGAMLAWGGVTALYTLREAHAAASFEGIIFDPVSIAFRMGLVLLVALMVGILASDLARERNRTAQALADLARIDTLRSRLVSSLAHDMRSPLAVITGALKAMEGDHPADLRARFSGMAMRQAVRLNRMVEGMLDLARIEQGQLELELEPTRLRAVVDAAVGALDEPDIEVRVTVDGGAHVMADPDRLEQIVFNLIGNALRHGRGPVEVTSAVRAEGVVLAVTDHGPGVPPERRAELFDAFTTSGSGGVGLGLWLVGALAEAHGGHARYCDIPEGACFEVVLREADGPDEAGGGTSPDTDEVPQLT